MPVSVHSDENRTPRAPTFPSTSKPSQRPPIPISFYSLTHHHTPRDLPPSLSDPVKTAPEFQRSPESDLVLRTTKIFPHTDFYVDRDTIYAGSIYMKQKLEDLGPVPEGIDVVSWEDYPETLDAMLRFMYPGRSKPVVRSVDHLRTLLKAARKYRIEVARHALGTAVLLDFAKKEPLQAFAIACEFGLADEAILISKDTLEIDVMMSDKNSDLGRVSLSYYHRLVQLHRKRAAQATEVLLLVDLERSKDEYNPPFCRGCGTNPTWWQIFVEYACIELKRRPVTTTIFSPSFLAKCVRTSKQLCEDCVESYMHARSQRLLVRLKEDIDGLPAYIMPDGPFPLD